MRSVYIFGNDKSIYKTRNGISHDTETSSTSSSLPILSVLRITRNTTEADLHAYAERLRGELEVIRQLYLADAKPESKKDYDDFLKVQQKLLTNVETIIELYGSYLDASKLLTADNRETSIKERIKSLNNESISLIQSYNNSGIFMNREFSVVVPSSKSYESVVRSRLLKAVGELS